MDFCVEGLGFQDPYIRYTHYAYVKKLSLTIVVGYLWLYNRFMPKTTESFVYMTLKMPGRQFFDGFLLAKSKDIKNG